MVRSFPGTVEDVCSKLHQLVPLSKAGERRTKFEQLFNIPYIATTVYAHERVYRNAHPIIKKHYFELNPEMPYMAFYRDADEYIKRDVIPDYDWRKREEYRTFRIRSYANFDSAHNLPLAHNSMVGTIDFLRHLMENPPSMGPKREDGTRDHIPEILGKKTVKHKSPTIRSVTPGHSSRPLHPLPISNGMFCSECEPRPMLISIHSSDTTFHVGVRDVVPRFAITFPIRILIPSHMVFQFNRGSYRLLLVVIVLMVSAVLLSSFDVSLTVWTR
jgi:hypothetical protein